MRGIRMSVIIAFPSMFTTLIWFSAVVGSGDDLTSSERREVIHQGFYFSDAAPISYLALFNVKAIR